MLRLTKNELFIGFTISVILSLFANFTLLMRHYDLMMDSKVSVLMCETEKCNFWFSIFWFFFFSFILFIFYRWMYKWGNKFFRGKEVKIIGIAMGVVLMELGKFEEAVESFNKVLLKSPDNEDAFFLKEECLDNL